MGKPTQLWHWIGLSSLVLAGFLIVDRQFGGIDEIGGSSATSSPNFVEGTSFYTLYHQGTPVGQIRTERSRNSPSGFLYDIRTELRLTAMGQSVEILAKIRPFRWELWFRNDYFLDGVGQTSNGEPR